MGENRNPIEEVWFGYHAKFNIKYVLPQYLIVIKMPERGPDGWYPMSGTGYPYSGQAFVYVVPNQNLGDCSQSGGTANVPSSDDTYPSITQIYAFISGTISPDQTSSWYQWTSGGVGRSSIPQNQLATGQVMASGIGVSGNPIYNYPSNQNVSNYQFTKSAGQTISGTFSPNVPTSESSWNV